MGVVTPLNATLWTEVKGVQRRAGVGEGSIGCDEGDPGWVEGTWDAVMGH